VEFSEESFSPEAEAPSLSDGSAEAKWKRNLEAATAAPDGFRNIHAGQTIQAGPAMKQRQRIVAIYLAYAVLLFSALIPKVLEVYGLMFLAVIGGAIVIVHSEWSVLNKKRNGKG